MTDTPPSGNDLRGAPPGTDKFALQIVVTRLEAQIAVLREQIDSLSENDERQDQKIADLDESVTGLTKEVAALVKDIKAWRKVAAQADESHALRLGKIERHINGFGSVLVLLQLIFEAWKASHGGH